EDFAPHIRAELKKELMVPGSMIFDPPPGVTCEQCRGDWRAWTKFRPGACWKRPEGEGSTVRGREKHPVVHVAWDDAVAYAGGAARRLPTEAGGGRAARGGGEGEPFYWGKELKPGGRWMANIWQGAFPGTNTKEDGFEGTAPAGSFPPNPYGLHD